MKKILVLAATLVLAGCLGPRIADHVVHITLIHKGPGRSLLEITRHEQVIVPGKETFVRKVSYRAALSGSGPIFTNPHFADNPPEYHCVGTIILDIEHNVVRIDLQRVVSKPGEPEQTEPHPANGMYRIEKVKNTKPGDWWF